MFKTVLFPIDASPEAQQAAFKTAELVKYHHSRLILLSVVETPNGYNPHPEQTSPEAVAQLLEKAKAVFTNQGIDTEAIERQGNPAFVICDVADEMSADLIVMGCRGTGLTPEGQSESVSNRVINLSPCPVMVVP
ncbi:universal stress protein [Leptolyngbya sp. Heron Island J]|uniref:universal stress protein n=1 Tax=Leptolyngbya sp. Heron Island J TaxID=1385935 RepID=UPI0003B96625|nr:universal stress protein [Leptolyngbya sp. Heron Island J]ESA32822.1 universal stress protein [Leptolyngbya sp. Heron Island J]